MIIPPIGGLTGGLGGTLGGAQAEGALKAPAAAQAEGLAQGAEPSGAIESTSGGFGSELTNAISSLEKTQQSGNSAAQALATGTVKDPETAVVTVEDAQLAMQLASQIRTKATEAVQSIFQTQA